jgi:histone H2B
LQFYGKKKIIFLNQKMSKSFDLYISKIQKQVHPEHQLTKEAKTKLNTLVQTFVQDFVKYLVLFTEHARKNTIGSREVQSAVRALLKGELAKHAVSEGTKAITRFTSFNEKDKRKSDAAKAGLVIPPVRIRTIIKENVDDYKTDTRISETTSFYLAAVIEYLIAEILELAGNVARDNNKIKITSAFIQKAITNDKELDKSFYCSLEKQYSFET